MVLQMVDVSIIIVNYNTKELTKQCIASIIQKTGEICYEIIVVDNASTDGSKEYFQNLENIVFLPQKNNLGFGKANNKGLKVATGKYVFFLNSDTYLRNNALKLFYDFMEGYDKKVGCIGCLLKDVNLDRTHSYADFPSKRELLLGRLLNPIYNLFGKKYHILDQGKAIKSNHFNVDYVTGADLFVRKEVLDKFGGFDPDFFMYYEETELQKRLTKHGYPSMIIVGPEIVHLEGASVNKQKGVRNYRKMMMVQKSQFIYFKKVSNTFYYVLYRLSFLIIRLPFLLFSNTPFNIKKEYLKLLIYS